MEYVQPLFFWSVTRSGSSLACGLWTVCKGIKTTDIALRHGDTRRDP